MDTVSTTTVFTTIDVVNLVNSIASLNLGYLTICVTVLALLGGGTYIFNIRPFKDRLENQEGILTKLKEEVEDNLTSSKAEILTDLQEFEKVQNDSIGKLVQQENDKLLLSVENKIAVFERNFSSRFDDFATEKDSNLKTVILAELSNQLRNLEDKLVEEVKKKTAEVNTKVNSFDSELREVKRSLSYIEDDMLDLQIEHHLNKNQIGALSKMLKKLEIATTKGWGVEGVLLKIRDYIKEREMPDIYYSDLVKAFEKVSSNFAPLKDEILKLATEKTYKAIG